MASKGSGQDVDESCLAFASDSRMVGEQAWVGGNHKVSFDQLVLAAYHACEEKVEGRGWEIKNIQDPASQARVGSHSPHKNRANG
jgi:hypothetical protein